MSGETEQSVTQWIGDLKAGDGGEPARRLWDRYFDRLARLAQGHLRATPRGPADGEDVALSAFDSFFRGAAAGRFPRLDGRDDLWKLLTTIAARKASNQRRHACRRKRGGGRVVADVDLAAGDPGGGDPLEQAAGGEPTPEFAAAVADEVRSLIGALEDESLRVVALLRMEGYAVEEIASALDVGPRTVERKLELIRKAWRREDRS
jgi:DNA-directed RNA polymerase specialized sigma24 family protein